jgi:hypothetical protein
MTRASTPSSPCSARCSRPDHVKTAQEMLRACRPGGTIAVASWTRAGSSGRCSRPISQARPAAGRRPAPAAVGDRGAPARDLRRRHRLARDRGVPYTFRFTSAEELVDYFLTLVRPDEQGVRRRVRAGRAARGPDRARQRARPPRNRRGRRPVHVPRSRRSPAMSVRGRRAPRVKNGTR